MINREEVSDKKVFGIIKPPFSINAFTNVIFQNFSWKYFEQRDKDDNGSITFNEISIKNLDILNESDNLKTSNPLLEKSGILPITYNNPEIIGKEYIWIFKRR